LENALYENNQCLPSELYETHKYTARVNTDHFHVNVNYIYMLRTML